VTHCQNPFPQALGGGRYRIHFSARDARNRSRGAWVDVHVAGDQIITEHVAPIPSLELGRLGAFDDAGAMPGCLVDTPDGLRMYYTGWTLGGTVPFQFEIGCAISADGGATFTRISEAPILGRNRHDPFVVGAPWVLRDGDGYRMWYAAGTEWKSDAASAGKPVHYYTIKHASSDDGLTWRTSDHRCIDYGEGEHAIARPVVVPDGDRLLMFYSARRLGEAYRVYVAVSHDGLSWERKPRPFLDVGSAAWENEMVCYAAPLQVDDRSFVLYNGNGYGSAGFGALLVTA
jgi:hypothetical protein